MFLYIYILQALTYCSVINLASTQETVNGTGTNVLTTPTNRSSPDISNRWMNNGVVYPDYKRFWNARLFSFLGRSWSLNYKKTEIPEQMALKRRRRSINNKVKRDVSDDSTLGDVESTTSVHDLDQSEHITQIPVIRSEQLNLGVTRVIIHHSTVLPHSSVGQDLYSTEPSNEDPADSDHTTLSDGDNNADYTTRTHSEINSEPTLMVTSIFGSDVSTLAPNTMTPVGDVASALNVPISEITNLTSDIIISELTTITPVITGSEHMYLNTGEFNSENITYSENVVVSRDVASSANTAISEQTTVSSTEPTTSVSTTATPEPTFISTEVYRSVITNMAHVGDTALAPNLLDSMPTTLSQVDIFSDHTAPYILNPDTHSTVGSFEISSVEIRTLSPDTAESMHTNIAELVLGSSQTPLNANEVALEFTTRSPASVGSINVSLLTQDLHSSENHLTRSPKLVTIENSTTLETNVAGLNTTSQATHLVSPTYESVTDLHIATAEHTVLASDSLMSAVQTSSSAPNELSSEEHVTLAPFDPVSHTSLSSGFVNLNQIMTSSTAQTSTTDDEISSIVPGEFRSPNPTPSVATMRIDNVTAPSLFVNSPIEYTDMTTDAFGSEKLTTLSPMEIRRLAEHTSIISEIVRMGDYNSMAPSDVLSPVQHTSLVLEVTSSERKTIMAQDATSALQHTALAQDLTSPIYPTAMVLEITSSLHYTGMGQDVTSSSYNTGMGQDFTSSLYHTGMGQDFTSSSYHTGMGQDFNNSSYHTGIGQDFTSSSYHTGMGQDVTSSLYHTGMGQDFTSSSYHTGMGQDFNNSSYHTGIGQDFTSSSYHTGMGQDVTSSLYHTGMGQDVTSSLYHTGMGQDFTSSSYHTGMGQDFTSSLHAPLQTDLLSLASEAIKAENFTPSSEQHTLVNLYRVSPEYTTMVPIQTLFTNTFTVAPSSDWSAQEAVTSSGSTPTGSTPSSFQNANPFKELTSELKTFELSETSTLLLPSTFDFHDGVLESSEQYDTTSSSLSGEMLQITPTDVGTPTQGLEHLISRSRLIYNSSSSQSLQDSLTISPISISEASFTSVSSIDLTKEISTYSLFSPSSPLLPSPSLQDLTRSTFISGTEAFSNLNLGSLIDSLTTNVPNEQITSFAAHSFTASVSSELKSSLGLVATHISNATELTTSRSTGIWHSLRPTNTITIFRTSVLSPSHVTKYSTSSFSTLSTTHVITKISPSSTRRESFSSSLAPTHIVITTAPSLKNITIQFFYESDCEVVSVSPFKEELVITLYKIFYEIMKINAKSINIGSPQCNPQQIIVSFGDAGKSALLASLREPGVTPFTLGPVHNRIWFNITDFREVVTREEKTGNVGDIVVIIVALCICVTLVSAGIIIFFKEIYLKRGRRNINATTEAPVAAKTSAGQGKSEKYISMEMTEARSADESYCSPYDAEYSSIGNGEFTSFTASGSCESTPARQENGRSSSPTAVKPKSKLQFRKPKRKSNASKTSGRYGLVVGLLGYQKPQVRPEAEDCHLYAVPEKNDLPIRHEYPEEHCYVNSPNPFRGDGSNGSLVRNSGALKQEGLVVNSSREQLVAKSSKEQLVAARQEPNVYNNCVYNAAFLSDQDPVTSSSFDSVHF